MTPFEEETGCIVTTQDSTDSANGVQLMQSGEYDGVSASGDATLRLIAGGEVSPINPSLFPNYANVFDGLKNCSRTTASTACRMACRMAAGPNLLALQHR